MANTDSNGIDASIPTAFWSLFAASWQVPTLCANLWWNVVADMVWPNLREHAEHDADHHQLAVPEPFEADSESGLFA